MITDLQGTITNLFEIYTSLKGTGSFSFYRDLGNDKKVVYGKGKAEGSLMEMGSLFKRILQDLYALVLI